VVPMFDRRVAAVGRVFVRMVAVNLMVAHDLIVHQAAPHAQGRPPTITPAAETSGKTSL
jgi:hypothetical protein